MVKRGSYLYNSIKLGVGGWGRGSPKQCVAWLNMGQSIYLSAPLMQIKMTRKFLFLIEFLPELVWGLIIIGTKFVEPFMLSI